MNHTQYTLYTLYTLSPLYPLYTLAMLEPVRHPPRPDEHMHTLRTHASVGALIHMQGMREDHCIRLYSPV